MLLTIAKINDLTPDIWEIELTGSFPYNQIQPGQFIMIEIVEGMNHLLRRPISIAATDGKSLTIIFRIVGPGTKWLSERNVGEKLDILGPLGNGFSLPPAQAKVLIVGGGIGVPPLYQLACEIETDTQPDLVFGFAKSTDLFWQTKYEQLGKLIITTDDGSSEIAGTVIDGINQLRSAGASWDYVYGCGPIPMLNAVKTAFIDQNIKGYVSLEERMACGVGACYGCVCTTNNEQTKRICVEGPVFDWNEVKL